MLKMVAPLSLFLPKLVLLILHQYFVACLALSNINTDKEAILAIKDGIKTDSASNLLKANWSRSSNSNINVCKWMGITCSTRHHRVSGLNISYMGVQGQIAPHIGNLSFLNFIDLRFNSFHGDLPQQMARLRRLRYLDLESNTINGIPSWIGDLEQLEHLEMSSNQIKLPIPDNIFNMSSLEHLSLENNSIPGSLPTNMCDNLPRLILLNFYTNKLEGRIPTSIGKCSSLEILIFESNYFTSFIPNDITNLTKLTILAFGANMLSAFVMAGSQIGLRLW